MLVLGFLLLLLRGQFVLVGVLARVRFFSPYAIQNAILKLVTCQRLAKVVIVTLVAIVAVSEKIKN
jgi:hypothetical protein